MKRHLLSILLVFIAFNLSAQRKVLLEGHMGAHCMQCPMGDYYLDSMVEIFPDVISVTLHSYSTQDSMYIPAFDTIAPPYTSGGAPLGCVDRKWSGLGSYAAMVHTQWQASIQQRLSVPPQASVNINSSWNSTTRIITATVSGSILSDLPTGDYRVNLYVVEDSVTGVGPGYDQANIYDQQVGNPFYGMGMFIQGFVHRRVVRAILPQAFGLGGVISATPMAGQTYTHTFVYTLPQNYDETQVSLVAFVAANSSNHLGDTVLNAARQQLPLTVNVRSNALEGATVHCYPNPATDGCTFSVSTESQCRLLVSDMAGRKVFSKEFTKRLKVNKNDLGTAGTYFYQVYEHDKLIAADKLQIIE